jgi:photosystem II stability/assembly factor-like uncharacterized protein
MIQKNIRASLVIACVCLLSASCNLFNKTTLSGMVKSVNGGADWQFINNLKSPQAGSLSGLNISKIYIDPLNHQVVYASAYNGGFYKSEDSGANWSRILSKILVYDFAFDPSDNKIIYASGIFADHGKILKTTDGGSSWLEIYNDATNQNPVRNIAVNPTQKNQIVAGTEFGTIIKSLDTGSSWQLVKDFSGRVNRILWQNNSVYVLIKSKGLFKATGFVDNFQELTGNLGKGVSIAGIALPFNANPVYNQVYVDNLSSSLIYLTTEKGVYKTTDEGKNWLYLQLPKKPEEGNPKPIVLSKTSSNIVYTAVGSTIYKSVDGGGSWQTQSIATNGYVNYIAIDPILPQINYAGIYVNQ